MIVFIIIMALTIIAYFLARWSADQVEKHKKDCNCPDCINHGYGVPL